MGRDVWEKAESVARFAGREPDVRLMEILDSVARPPATRVLDLGCAAGRNTAVLAARRFDFQALDGSRAMVEHTRARVAEILGADEATRRVHRGPMDDLSRFADGAFDLVVALGVYHCAASGAEWRRAVSETARVLAPGGRLLVAVFTPETDLHGDGIEPVAGEPHVYSGFSSGRTFLLDRRRLDAAMSEHGLEPAVPSRTVRVPLAKGRRVVVNALYRRTDGPAAPREESVAGAPTGPGPGDRG